MLWPQSLPSHEQLFAVLTLTLALSFTAGRVGAEESSRQLQLDVIVNGSPTQLIGSFVLDRGRIAARRAELGEIGLNPRGYESPDKLIVLDDLPGLSYRYDEAAQRISITVPDELRATKDYDASNRSQEVSAPQSDYGSVLNYTLFTASSSNFTTHTRAFNGASATLDGRAFTPFGTLGQSAILRTSFDTRFDALRLNTTFAYSDQDTLVTYRAGDTVSGGLAWTRPVRIGGFQAQRNFGLRADLVTLPLPSATGSAAVPSTVDVYVNNIKTFSQDVGTGPYRLSNLPAVAGSGMTRVVLRDSSGRETQTSLPFYTSASLLAPGLLDYSLEAGVPRLSYGTTSDTYIAKPVGSGSLRYGFSDWLTIAGHAELATDLVNASAGLVVRTGSFGLASMALAASHHGSGTGFQSYLSYETKILGININASSQRTFGPYDDLASVTSRLQAKTVSDPFGFGSLAKLNSSTNAIAQSLYTSARPPRSLDRISMGVPLPFDRSSFSVSFVNLNDSAGASSKILTASLSFGLPYEASIFATAFADFGDKKNLGVLAGLSMPLGGSVTASTSVSQSKDGTSVNFEASKPLEQKPGSYGWRVRDSEGAGAQRTAATSYRSSYGRVEVGVGQDRKGGIATAEVDGAIATMGGGVFFANRIDDAFAVVETGAPGVEVFHENRSVGVTNSSGKALVPGLRSYQKNKIAIDTSTLPVDSDVANTQSTVVPADRTGVRVNFAVKTNNPSAIVLLTEPNGTPLAAGAHGQVDGGESFVVGYDGKAYVKGLGAENNITVTLADRECRASFPFTARPNEQVVISQVICR